MRSPEKHETSEQHIKYLLQTIKRRGFAAASLLHSPQADLAVFVSRGDAVVFWVTGDARERVLAALLVVLFEEKPIDNRHEDRK